jgi:hypothetical protein
MQRFLLAVLFPLLAIITIATYAGGLGVIFMVLEETMHSENGVIVLGLALVIGVPTVAYLAERAVEK